MKKLFSTALAFGLSISMFAQKINSSKVPAAVKEAVTKSHPQVAVKWEWEDKTYEANFKENGRKMSCIITKEGVLLETETEIKLTELPKASQDYIAKAYRGKKIRETAKIVSVDGTTFYEVVTGNKELMFDAAGNFTKQKTEKD